MTDFIVEAITGADVGKYLATFIISMIPVIELRGAIPIGVSLGLSHVEAMGISIIGNMLPRAPSSSCSYGRYSNG